MGQQYTEAETSRFVTVPKDGKDYEVHYNDCDPGAGGNTVIMLHGSGPGATSWANFNRNITPLTDAGYRVVLLDVPGWGQSSPIICNGSRSHLNAHFVKGFVDAQGLERVHLVGNSMGAQSCTAFTLDNPERVGKLILMGGGTGGVSPFQPMPTEGIKRIMKLYRDPTVENIRALMEIFVFDTSELTEDLFKMRLDNMMSREEHLNNFVRSFELDPKQYPDYGPQLTQIKADTLIIWGRNDRFVPMDAGLRLLANIPNSQLHVFNNCGHWAQWEHADRFNRMVVDFLTH